MNINEEDKGEYKGQWNPTGSYTVGDVVLHETGYWLKLPVTEIGGCKQQSVTPQKEK